MNQEDFDRLKRHPRRPHSVWNGGWAYLPMWMTTESDHRFAPACPCGSMNVKGALILAGRMVRWSQSRLAELPKEQLKKIAVRATAENETIHNEPFGVLPDWWPMQSWRQMRRAERGIRTTVRTISSGVRTSTRAKSDLTANPAETSTKAEGAGRGKFNLAVPMRRGWNTIERMLLPEECLKQIGELVYL